MIVSPIRYNSSELHEEAQFYLSGRDPVNVIYDNLYGVHSVLTQYVTVYFLIIDNLGVPQWLPAEIFKIVDATVLHDWVVDVFNNGREIIIGPSYIAQDESYFSLLSEGHEATVKDFLSRQSE
ncbi:hypothetical protein [Deinococcus sp. QL22]|uniref:hypothetical protein n=1 Tax=Deinococcus sp. QL22 TaxID=2939437 RepID=UPI002016CB44|nr:hypothetical protein [Deinococcus sp. QL22]UQN10697.1 hypothetical protein M1R55_30465 [Deinococcus sp. QL22]